MRRMVTLSSVVLLVALASSHAGALPAVGSEVRAVELAAPTPAWYTAELHAEVVAAGRFGVPVPAEVGAATTSLALEGIRPGSWMVSPAWCTMNFVFGSGANQAIGTAGHCTEVGDEVVVLMAPDLLVHIGNTVRSVDEGIGDDFALVSINQDLHDLVDPSMAVVAGPAGTADPAVGDAILHVGHGLVVGTGGTARPGVVTYRGPGDGGEAYGWDGIANLGDSGSPARHLEGSAVGNLTHLVVGGPYVPAIIAGTTAERMEQIAGMSIATASLTPAP